MDAFEAQGLKYDNFELQYNTVKCTLNRRNRPFTLRVPNRVPKLLTHLTKERRVYVLCEEICNWDKVTKCIATLYFKHDFVTLMYTYSVKQDHIRVFCVKFPRIHYTRQRNSKSCSLSAYYETIVYCTFDTLYSLMKFYRRDAHNVRKRRDKAKI